MFYWTAFGDLSTERQIGMGVGSIPLSKIKAYGADDLAIECCDEMDRFCAIIRKMDEDYVSSANSSSKTKDKKKPTEIAADDAQGVRQMMRNLKARKESEAKKKKPNIKP